MSVFNKIKKGLEEAINYEKNNDYLAWDPDYTKVTDEEKKQIERAENSGFIDESEIDWDNVGK